MSGNETITEDGKWDHYWTSERQRPACFTSNWKLRYYSAMSISGEKFFVIDNIVSVMQNDQKCICTVNKILFNNFFSCQTSWNLFLYKGDISYRHIINIWNLISGIIFISIEFPSITWLILYYVIYVPLENLSLIYGDVTIAVLPMSFEQGSIFIVPLFLR
jgi:hypothetical protein